MLSIKPSSWDDGPVASTNSWEILNMHQMMKTISSSNQSGSKGLRRKLEVETQELRGHLEQNDGYSHTNWHTHWRESEDMTGINGKERIFTRCPSPQGRQKKASMIWRLVVRWLRVASIRAWKGLRLYYPATEPLRPSRLTPDQAPPKSQIRADFRPFLGIFGLFPANFGQKRPKSTQNRLLQGRLVGVFGRVGEGVCGWKSGHKERTITKSKIQVLEPEFLQVFLQTSLSVLQ